jgi:hypothetical protein
MLLLMCLSRYSLRFAVDLQPPLVTFSLSTATAAILLGLAAPGMVGRAAAAPGLVGRAVATPVMVGRAAAAPGLVGRAVAALLW